MIFQPLPTGIFSSDRSSNRFQLMANTKPVIDFIGVGISNRSSNRFQPEPEQPPLRIPLRGILPPVRVRARALRAAAPSASGPAPDGFRFRERRERFTEAAA